ncbi:MAG: hypothetical protein NZM35_03940 [Chitinophagales bacterium]|nr:hypothetical protein [Chitinophagales bacterium]MDW8418747.1 hypothetical protein [Chitinophagales bacterium]
MEEKMIKDFDRAIERMLGDYTVNPPHGMWNRISGELDGIATASPASPAAVAIPKGVIFGFIAGASLAGALMTAMLLYHKSNHQPNTPRSGSNPAATETMVSIPENATPPVAVSVPAAEIKVTQAAVAPVRKKSSFSVAGQPVVAQTVEEAPSNTLPAETNALVTETTVNNLEAAVNDNTSASETLNELRLLQLQQSFSPVSGVSVDKQDEDEDKKLKQVATSYSEKKIKYKKRRPARFSYGHINRVKKKY